MKKILIATLVACLPLAVNARTVNNSDSDSAAIAGVGEVSPSQSLKVVHEAAPIPADTKADIKTVPDVSAPGLTTTMTETCMGSTSGGVAWLGFGITGGTTWRDGRCANRLDARQMGQFGVQVNDARLVHAGVELLCETSSVQRAAARAGVICGPQDDDAEPVDERQPEPIVERQVNAGSDLPAWFAANE